MTRRERIADWISGGALTSARNAHHLAIKIQKLAKEDRAAALDRLDRIAAQETSGANATVRRMARIARGEA